MDDFGIGFLGVYDFIKVVGGEIVDEFVYGLSVEMVVVEIVGGVCYIEIDQCVVVVEGDVFWVKGGYDVFFLVFMFCCLDYKLVFFVLIV